MAMQNPIAAAYAPDERPIHRFTIPAQYAKYKMPGFEPVTSIGLVELLASEQKMVYRRCKDEDGASTLVALMTTALRTVNDQPVGTGDGSADTWIERGMHPKVRDLVGLAYRQVNMADDKVADDFLKSQTVASGSI